MTVVLTGGKLTLDEVVRVARGGERAELAEEAAGRMRASRSVLEDALARGVPVYGITTGVGAKRSARVEPGDTAARERLLVRNHLVGQGPPLPPDVVAGAMLRLANGLASGATGARPELAEALVSALNAGLRPVVRRLGSSGMADLSANADLAEGALGSFPLAAGEGIALLNHNAVSTAHAALALADAEALLAALDVAGALDLEAFAANLGALDEAIAAARPYPGLARTLARLRALLRGSGLWEPGAARNLQDPLSFRCLPHVHGAAGDALSFARGQLAVELNAAQGNPLVVTEGGGRIASVGNFDVLPLAAALDLVRIALAPVVTAAAERAIKLLQRPQTGLPEGLAARPGLQEDGLAELGIAAEAIAAEARLLAQPVSFELASTSQAEGIEDRITSAPLGARRLAELVELGARVAAIELAVAAQAAELRGRGPLGAGAAGALELVRQRIPHTGEGEPVPPDLEPLVELVRSGLLGSLGELPEPGLAGA
jgi:histidine ammonia-lyase